MSIAIEVGRLLPSGKSLKRSGVKMEKTPKNNPNTSLNLDYQALLDENRALREEVHSLRARLEEPEELRRLSARET